MTSKQGKRTPGPWEVVRGRNGHNDGHAAITSIGPINPDHNHWDGPCLNVPDADAVLISKAPEMLEALRQMTTLAMKWAAHLRAKSDAGDPLYTSAAESCEAQCDKAESILSQLDTKEG